MKRHPFQPFVALVGVALVLLGVLVATFGFEQVGDDVLVWAAIATGVVGIALFPWRSLRAESDSDPDPDLVNT